MTLKKDDALREIEADFERLSNLVLEQLDHLEQLLTSGDLKISDDVMHTIGDNEKEIDKAEVKLSDKIINTIVLHQPMASELRRIMACYRILINVERIGDLVLNICHFIKRIKTPELYNQFSEVLSSMAILSARMVRQSLLSFMQHDRELAIWTIKNDDILDEVNDKLLKKLLNKTGSEEKTRHLLTSMVTIKEMMSNIERIADYATNIAEAAIYAIEGKDIRHHKLEE
ncbi:MAG: PhoU domain-containing protein [Mangrovibacterium sp.]|nr:PhoU domain-containing protein [Mangrovibacterium sp.]